MLGSPPSTPAFDPNAEQQPTPPSADQGGYGIATRPRYLADPSRPTDDPVALTMIGVLSDMLDVLLGTYNGKHRPAQLNITPGALGFTSHTRFRVSGIKGSAGTAGTIVDIRIGSEVVETIYCAVGVPFAFPAALWIDRGQTITAVDRTAGAVDFSVILIASEAD